MAVNYSIWYHPAVKHDDIAKLSAHWKTRIKHAIETKLTQKPEVFGRPLRRSLKGYRKLRVGDYRVVFAIELRKIKIFAIIHRSIVYRDVRKRI